MKKQIEVLIMIMIVLIISPTSVYARDNYCFAVATSEYSELLSASVKESFVREVGKPRGVFFGVAELKIYNDNGKIGVSAKAYMKEPVDEVYMTIYLDRLSEKNQWIQVGYYDYEFYAADYPNGLIDPGVDFTIMNQPSGNYYRLRGSYAAILDGEMEGFGPVTDGILIE